MFVAALPLSMLSFVGLGLYDEKDISVKGREAIEKADNVYAEFYTSALPGASIDRLREFHSLEIEVVSREVVEEKADEILDEASEGDVVFLSGGDAMVSTTHTDLRLRAIEREIETRVVHGCSVSSAVSGATGLQNYRFGASTTLPFPKDGWKPRSPIETVYKNLERDLHTLIYLDIEDNGDDERFMAASQAAEILSDIDDENRIDSAVAVARMGSDSTQVNHASLDKLQNTDHGPPLHILVVPASLHQVEKEFLDKMG